MLRKPRPAVPVSRTLPRTQSENALTFKGYPHHCYVRDEYNDITSVIYPGEHTYFKPKVPAEAHADPAELNRQYGVTPAQVAACEAGLAEGWQSPRANPMAYNAAGEYLGG